MTTPSSALYRTWNDARYDIDWITMCYVVSRHSFIFLDRMILSFCEIGHTHKKFLDKLNIALNTHEFNLNLFDY